MKERFVGVVYLEGMNRLFSLLISFLALSAWAQPENRYLDNRTYEHAELIEEYRALEVAYEEADLIEYGPTDVGRPLHLFVMNKAKVFDPLRIEKQSTILILNGIHPGESCGIDASLKWAHDMLSSGSLPPHVVIAIVPVYNIGGALNRRPQTRANQNGPVGQGFRGNARNLDLNRDFIKADALNTQSLYAIFQDWDPDVFVDTHTTDGADFPYNLTLIGTQPDALGPIMGQYMRQIFEPALYMEMSLQEEEITPYVNVFGADPFEGWNRFFESPRYSSGFAGLHHTFSFVTEAHMLKPYSDRVEATYTFLSTITQYLEVHRFQIESLRSASRDQSLEATSWPVAWALDTTRMTRLSFKGYPAIMVPMEAVEGEKIVFDQTQVAKRDVDYYEWYKPTVEVQIPDYYVVPQAWREIIDRLKWNGVQMERLSADSTAAVEVTYITSFENARGPYEGHYSHGDSVGVLRESDTVQLYKGDYLIPTNQKARRFILETLEPEATDSYFRWGFFDSALQQKEWYSSYIFDTTAVRMLNEDPALQKEFERAKLEDPNLASSGRFQMYWLYQRSELFERSNRYPIYRSFQ